ncbi:aspartyl-tRNA(Asn)/glutamyl-tRNA(Gln) amidotransferase subunit A [Pseudonocardia sediminis]|uniref:Aspartyl-tRNA(Asn)/glutamyl-tRNA(Gln) amidotransferase subunit A n=1 Tax=Pseudonocardia sediminis TaxID=1397368 RepID=A0A4V2FQC6_PSEST|nr:amidase [Pseudonocardia sediminis]RZT83530.1 aspartyl-tRNA(Asn)/glutamyl-tRNA(Gln) amidotransferase subunit A [Pseudonocardia sediminis]
MFSLPDLVRALSDGTITPSDHVEDVLERLAGDTTNSVVTLDAEGARRRAAELTESARRGERTGPLHGVAVGVKDLIDVAGLPTRCGSQILADAPPAGADAPIVARLRAAGAVVVGKLHTHEFAYGPLGDTAATGPARNPHALTRITGGSSSGSAATLAAGHLALTIGTDTGASVRTPAALCGVVGLKPRRGVLPGDGVFPLSASFDTVGLLAPDVASAGLAWDALTGAGARDDVRGLRVGVPEDEYWHPHDPVLAAAVTAAADALDRAGAEVVAVRTPGVAELAATYPTIGGAEAYATHREWFESRRDEYRPATRDRLDAQAGTLAHAYVTAQRARRRLGDDLLAHLGARVDVVLTATTRLRATPIGAEEVDVADGGSAHVRTSMLALTSPFNLTDRPALSVPVALPADGLPAGVQLAAVGPDVTPILRAAAAVEGV